MLNIWLGALLVVVGFLLMVAQPLWRGRLSGRKQGARDEQATLEPRKRGSGFGLAANWPWIAMIALGAALLLIEALGPSPAASYQP